jgi:hypothetical protein
MSKIKTFSGFDCLSISYVSKLTGRDTILLTEQSEFHAVSVCTLINTAYCNLKSKAKRPPLVVHTTIV